MGTVHGVSCIITSRISLYVFAYYSHICLQFHRTMGLVVEKTVLGMLVQVFWYHSPHLMHLVMFTDRPSNIQQLKKKMGV